MTALIIFTLLIALMLTGMPISIALGMTVLTFIFTMTNVPTESVALKLFTGIDNFEIMAIPFFILAGNFLTHGGVARRMINFATSMVGHWHGGLGLAGVILQLGLGGLLLFGLFFGVLTVFGATARYAVRYDQPLLRTVTRTSECAPPARTGVLIINPKS